MLSEWLSSAEHKPLAEQCFAATRSEFQLPTGATGIRPSLGDRDFVSVPSVLIIAGRVSPSHHAEALAVDPSSVITGSLAAKDLLTSTWRTSAARASASRV